MNKHIAQAKTCLAKGDNYYTEAAQHIIAARKEDPKLTYRRIAEQLGRSEAWVWKLAQHRINNLSDPEDFVPFGGGEQNGARYERHAKTASRSAVAPIALERFQ